MTISVFPPGRGIPNTTTLFALQQNTWNDFGFRTFYELFYRPDLQLQAVLIGGVKILRLGQTSRDGVLVNNPFDALSPSFCSVGTSLDYYKRLTELPDEHEEYVLRSLRDIVAAPQLRTSFRSEDGWSTSLFRDDPDPDSFLIDAAAMRSGDYSQFAELDAKLEFVPAGWSTTVSLDFNAPSPHRKSYLPGFSPHTIPLPKRMIVLVGRNGSGKSTLLSRIARIAYASPFDRTKTDARQLGSFVPSSVAFTRVLTISYSAFDSFILPSNSRNELSQLANEIDKGAGRFVYAGLRDVANEARDDIDISDHRAQTEPYNFATRIDRRSSTKLKSLDQLASEFGALIDRIKNNDTSLFQAALSPLLKEPSFSGLPGATIGELLTGSPAEAFRHWSTGHKIVMHSIASLVANTQHRSLILFDEPETHLHPPLIAALMHALRAVLERKKAFALVATHSPVVLQETLARNVRVITRIDHAFDVKAPDFETFGENVGILTYNTFRLTAESTDFHKTLDELIAAYDSVEEINTFFTPQLSSQSLAYVMAGLSKKARRT